MANYSEKYALWTKCATEDPDLTQELLKISDDEDAISDRFYKDLEFGTGGLRGVIGAGDNRMNIYTVRKATQGLANYLKSKKPSPSVAISFDSRIKSDIFAKNAAQVLAAAGIKVYIYSELQPTPVLSFTVRELGCDAGIMITASHNPAKYNGYKCYGPDGCQITDEFASAVMSCILGVDIFADVKTVSFEDGISSGIIEYVPESVLERYFENVLARRINPSIYDSSDLKVLYTPLNGTGNKPVREILKRANIKSLKVVSEQELPDGNFPTAPYPNPEIRQAFECALKEAQSYNPDIILATDPDCDRVGIAVRDDNGEYKLMSGNEVGCMLLNYILSCKQKDGTLLPESIAITTIVSSKLSHSIAKKYGCRILEVLTGFKYIGEQIGYLEEQGKEDTFVLGFEESYGYLSGGYVRDKDGVVASMLICEMAAFYKNMGKNLITVMEDIYAEFGVFSHTLVNVTFEGEQGMVRMKEIMDTLRKAPLSEVAGFKVVTISDYLLSKSKVLSDGTEQDIFLPKSNVLSFELENNMSLIIRPSGTEPKIKAYITACAATRDMAASIAAKLESKAQEILK